MGDLSAHFSRREFACKCGCGLDTVDKRLLDLCELVRTWTGGPVRVVSGHRCQEHNRRVGGSPKSQHVLGRAADLAVPNPPAL